jgi:hypothetical protein
MDLNSQLKVYIYLYFIIIIYFHINKTLDGRGVVELKAEKEEEAEFYRMGAAHGGYDLVPKMQIPFLILTGIYKKKEQKN